LGTKSNCAPLKVIYHNEPPRVIVRNKTYIDLYVRVGNTTEQRKKVMTEWYREQLKIELPVLIEKWENKIGIKLDSWAVKKMQRKWGTCHIECKKIWLNLELIKKPPKCLEYIIVHEMIHLLERQHNERYRAYLDKFMPNWRGLREELNRFVL
jgi:predicted metal-dependent hydrolase